MLKQNSADPYDKQDAIVSVYELHPAIWDDSAFEIKRFESPSKDWLNFMLDCRKGVAHPYEVVFGAVANDKVYATISLFESDVLTVEETIARLKVDDYFNQISLHSKAAIAKLIFKQQIIIKDL